MAEAIADAPGTKAFNDAILDRLGNISSVSRTYFDLVGETVNILRNAQKNQAHYDVAADLILVGLLYSKGVLP